MGRKFLVIVFVLLLSATISLAVETEYRVEPYHGQYGGTLINPSLGSGPKTLNPTVARETSSTDIIDRFLDFLIELDQYGTIQSEGRLAKSWDRLEGGKVWIFHLRKGVLWSDGVPFTADDVVWSFNKVWENPKIPSGGQDVIKDAEGNFPGVEKIDDYTVKFTLKMAFRPFLRSVGLTQILPKHVLAKSVEDGTFQQQWTVNDVDKIVGTGPFIPSEYVSGERVVLKRNPHYWRKDLDGKVLPYLDGEVFKIIADQNAILLAFESGEVDHMGPRSADYPRLRKEAVQKGFVVGLDGPTFGTQFFCFNFNTPDPVKRKWFRNEYFRKAVAYAFDKESVINTAYNGLADAQWSAVSAAAKYFYDPKVRKYPFNLNFARAMLKLGGFKLVGGDLVDKDGNPVKFIITTNSGNTVREDMCNILVEKLKQLGMDVTFAPQDFNSLVKKLLNTGDWEGLMIGLTGGVDPHSGSNVWKLDGDLHFWNYSPEKREYVKKQNDYYSPEWAKEIDTIYKQETTVSDEEAKVLFNKFQETVAEHLPLIYTVQQKYIYAYSKKVHNVAPTAFGGRIWNEYAIWKEK